MKASQLRQSFLDFFTGRGHVVAPSSSLVPVDDPSVLLTTAGMQQFKSYYLGLADPERDDHPGLSRPLGSRNIVSIQKSFRTSDIDEVGDASHLTFFEMLGNFSFGGYFKEEAIAYAHQFITAELGLSIAGVTVFGGNDLVPPDDESAHWWRKLGVIAIKEEGIADVFWGPTGNAGPCGPTTEIYCLNLAGEPVEIWNIVFNQFFFPGSREELLAGRSGKQLQPLDVPGVDTGLGLERLSLIVNHQRTVFETDLFQPIFSGLEAIQGERAKRIVADHLRAVVFLVADGLRPSNKAAGYVLRRLLRRLLVSGAGLDWPRLLTTIVNHYRPFYSTLDAAVVSEVLTAEEHQFKGVLTAGLRRLKKLQTIDAAAAFHLYETFGLPYEVIKDHAPGLKRADFEVEFRRHQEASRVGAGHFAGGLTDHQPATIQLHTAHHLLLASLKQVLGVGVKQQGSHVNRERLRLDFSFSRKLTEAEKMQVENLVNQKIREDLPVSRREMSRVEAEALGAEHEFDAKYSDQVSVYFIGVADGRAFSKEFCSGPHVARTGELGRFRIVKEEAVAAGRRRLRAVLDPN